MSEFTSKPMDLQECIESKKTSSVKLHLGCGGVKWKDFINVDLYPFDENTPDTSRSGCVADVFADIRNLQLPENYVDEIFSSHVIEHFYRWEVMDIISNWYRILKPGGIMVTEMPDIFRSILFSFLPIRRYRQLGKNQFYGNQWNKLSYETHKYVWTLKEFKNELYKTGFTKVRGNHWPETHVKFRDMRVIAIK